MINNEMKEAKTYSSQKNQQIAETYAATRLRRSAQTIMQIDLKVKYGKKNNMPQKQIDFFYNVLIEAKRFKNHILAVKTLPVKVNFMFFNTLPVLFCM